MDVDKCAHKKPSLLDKCLTLKVIGKLVFGPNKEVKCERKVHACQLEDWYLNSKVARNVLGECSATNQAQCYDLSHKYVED